MRTAVTPKQHEMRNALAGFSTGVVLVAATHSGRPVGMLAGSFTSVSLNPPLVSVAFARTSTTWPLLRDVKRWGINVLAEDQADHAPLLSRPSGVRFDGVVAKETEDRHGGLVLAGSSLTLTVTQDPVAEAERIARWATSSIQRFEARGTRYALK